MVNGEKLQIQRQIRLPFTVSHTPGALRLVSSVSFVLKPPPLSASPTASDTETTPEFATILPTDP
jgi:hypothetical protein